MENKEHKSQSKSELLKKQYEEKSGVPLAPSLQQFCDLDPDFFEAYIAYRSVPWERGVLSPKIKEFIYIAIDAAVTHMYGVGLKLHFKRALDMGATKEEILEVLELVSVLGIHTMMLSVPLLQEELENRPNMDMNESQKRKSELFKKQYEEKAGVPLAPSLQQFCDLDPDFFEAYIAYRSVPWERGVLSPKVKEFIYIAIDASVTHLYDVGLKLHFKRALDMGATKEEILEVLELVSVLGIHTMMLGVPLLQEELEKRD